MAETAPEEWSSAAACSIVANESQAARVKIRKGGDKEYVHTRLRN
jgi:hypothetical protein